MFPLLRYFSIASFLALALVATIIMVMNRRLAVAQLVERGEVTNIALTQVFGNSMWSRFSEYVTGVSGLDGDALRRRPESAELRETIRALVHDLPVLRVKIYNLEGLTVYSTDESQIGEDRSQDPGFLSAARKHRAASKLSRKGRMSAFSGEVFDRDIVETYVPIHVFRPHGHKEIDAVFEFYSDVTPLVAEINAVQRRLLFGLASIFGLLYGALFLIVRRADRILKQQYREILSNEQALRGEKLAAEAAARSKGEFLANMSHEIRTPMTAILGFTDLLAEEAQRSGASSREREAIETIQRNGEHLLDVINEILDLSKIEAGRLEPESTAFSPTALAEEVLTLMRPRANEKALSLELEIDGAVPAAVESDPTRIRQILINLVGNAIKFTDRGGVKIALAHLEQPTRPILSLSVRDTGIGMSADEAGRIFEAFTQGDSSATRKYAGTGLGLTISERLTSLLGGTIEVESEPGKGSTLRVKLPVRVVERSRLRTAESGSAAASAGRRPHIWRPLPQLPRGCRVLIAEDGRDNQQLIADTLRRAGAKVEFAGDGAEAVDKALQAERAGQPFEVVLMDMQMPILDGYRAASKLRASGYSRPIIALTAHAMPSDRQKCLEAGCDDYVSKPIDRHGMLLLIGRHAKTQSDRPAA